MESANIKTIHDLPVEIIEIVFQFLDDKGLDACFKVCRRWWSILNKNKYWKKHCEFSEKYFIKNNKFNDLESDHKSEDPPELWIWRKYYEHEQMLWKNWSEGRFVLEKTDLPASRFKDSFSFVFVDDHGNHWLFNSLDRLGIQVWNITDKPVLHCQIPETGTNIRMCFVKNMLLIFRSDYVKVFKFMYPDYNMKLEYRFIFDMDSILPNDEMISDGRFKMFSLHIIVDSFLVGYSKPITNINTTFMHIWDLDKAKKVATQSIFQQSFVDFVRSSGGSDVTREFKGVLLLEGDSGRFLVTLVDIAGFSQVSLFSLNTMKFVDVIVQLVTSDVWCSMKGDVIVIWYLLTDETPKVSIYNVSGQVLSVLDMPYNWNPFLTKRIWLSGSKVVVKLNEKIHVLHVINSNEVCEKVLGGDEKDYYILSFFGPKFLMLYDKHGDMESLNSQTMRVSIWDVDLGVKLWDLKNNLNIQKLIGYLVRGVDIQQFFGYLERGVEYPGKLLVKQAGFEELHILNFDKDGA